MQFAALDWKQLVAVFLLAQVADPSGPLTPPTEAELLELYRRPKTVHCRDLYERVLIIGELGHALGQTVTVRGKWVWPSPAKPASPDFMITQVDGRVLDKPVKFSADFGGIGPASDHVSKLTIKVGEEWELFGVETGGFVGFSQEVWVDIQKATGEPVAYMGPQGFVTRFRYITATRIAGAKPPGNEKK